MAAKKEFRIVVNQIGAFIELHGHHERPITVGKISDAAIREYREDAIRLNSDMRYAVLGQLILAVAKRWHESASQHCPDIGLSPSLWEYNATTDRYSRAG